jgi:TonB family protein
MLPTFLVLLTLACGGASVRDGDQKKGAPAASRSEEPGAKRKEKGHVVSVKGPCGEAPCCKPIPITLPAKLDPKVFSPRMALKLSVDPDGSVRRVEITKSSGVEDVDRQLREGASRWCMEKTKEGREVDFMINLDVR